MNKKNKDVEVPIKQHKDSKGKHPHIIMDNVDDKHISVGLTHSPKSGKNKPNFKLKKNPLGGPKTSYVRRQGTVDNKKQYSKSARKGKVDKEDFAKLETYSERAKKKYLSKTTRNGKSNKK